MPKPAADVDVKELILDAADERFRQFGYNKTTMAEIAQDCNMSAANLYRFFANKQDIGAGLAKRCLAECECRLNEASEVDNKTASQRLENFILEMLHYTHEQWSEYPRINELVQAVIAERPDMVQHHKQTKLKMMMAIIQQGNESGEFDAADIEEAAETVLMSITMVSVPLFMHLYPLEELERIAGNITRLLLKGLLKC